MSRYERVYGADWTSLDAEEAIDRAYALGVAAAIGEPHEGELDRIRDQVDTAYSQSVVDLAFDEGRTEAREATPDADEESEAVWSALVGSRDGAAGESDRVGGRDGLPEALGVSGALDRPDLDSTEPMDLPEFLRRG